MRQNTDLEPLGPLARGMAQSGLRLANERTILTLVAISPGTSNADLARTSGLGPQTTSRILSELETRGILIRGSVLRGRRGQPATPYFLNPEAAYTLGVELGWRHTHIVLLDFVGTVLAQNCRSHPFPDARTVVEELAQDIADVAEHLTADQRRRLLGIGIGMPGRIERNISMLGAPPEQFTLWQGLDVPGGLEEATGLRVEAFNDGSAGCWAEMSRNSQARHQGFAYFHAGVFVGGGIIMDGQLWDGPAGSGANLGSVMVFDADGSPSFVHLVGSIVALENRLKAAGRPLPPGCPTDWNWDELEPVAGEWMAAAGAALAQGIISTQAVAGIDLAVIDGVMPRPIVERLVETIQAALARTPELTNAHPRVEIGHFGGTAAAMGAAHRLAYNSYFSRGWNLLAT